MTNSEIETSSTTGNGGAIYNSGTVRVTSGSTVRSSTARYGGGIYTTGGNANVQINQNSTVKDNRASQDGGGIYVDEGGTMQISDSTFDDNDAEGEGGAVYAGGGDVTITKSTFEDNAADFDGGAVSIHEGRVTVTTSFFTTNSAEGAGGAIFAGENGRYSINHSSFADNSASLGGALSDYTDGALASPSRISASTFAFNDATYGGGAIFYIGYEELNIVNSTFSSNQASQGGAFEAGFTTGPITIANSTFYGNAATTGATLSTQQPLTLNNNIITHSDDPSTATVFGDGTACAGTILPLAGRNNLVGTSISTAAGYTTYTEGSCGPFPSFTLPSVTYFDTVLGDNGGPDVGVDNDPLETHALLTGSNALGAGWNSCPDPTTGAPLTLDQISQPRPGGAVAGCDAGAFELQ